MKKILVIVVFLQLVLTAAAGIAQEQVATANESGNVDALMESGRRLMQQGKMDEALQVLEAVLKQDPSNAEAFFRAGNIYLRRGQVPKGVNYVERSVQLQPNNLRLRLELARTYENVQLQDSAIAEFRRLAAMAPDAPEGRDAHKRARVLAGRQYGVQGKYEQALQLFSSVLADYPNDVPTLIDQGLTFFFMGRIDEAQSIFEKALAIEPDNGLVHKDLGEVFEKKGDAERSAMHFERALQLIPPNIPLIPGITTKLALIRGAQYLAKGQNAEARREYEAALAADPRNPVARFNLATIYHDLGDMEGAQRMLRSLIEDNPADLEVKLRLGALYLEQGKPDEATQLLEDIVAKGGSSPQVQRARDILATIAATARQGQGQGASSNERIALLRAKVDENPEDRQAWIDLGLLYAQTRSIDKAIEAFENVVRITPDDARAHGMLGGLYSDDGNIDKALVELNKSLDLEQDVAQKDKVGKQILLLYPRKALAAGNVDEAERELKAIIADDRDNFVAHFFLAVIHAGRDKTDEATAEYQEVLRIVPGHAAARFYLANIAERTGHEEQAVADYRAVASSQVPELSGQARSRLESLLKRVGGFSYNFGYSLNFDSNSNLSSVNPIQETRSDTNGSVSYQRKLHDKRIFVGLRFSPVYTVLHQQQTDFMQMTLSPYVNGVWRDFNLSANYSYSQTDGVLVEQNFNKSHSLYMEASKRFTMWSILPFLTAKEQRRQTPSAWRLNGSYRMFETASSPVNDANSFAISAGLNQGSSSGWSWSGGYSYTNNQNVVPAGNDFAYTSHGVNVQLSKSISPKLNASSSYGYLYSAFTHPDSITGFTKNRVNNFHSLSLGLNYSVSSSLIFFCNYLYQLNNSNLPMGFIVTTTDVGTAVGFSVPSLGDYRKYSLTAGFSLNF